MPWKGEKDPYLIWLSEIILQQTRVEQGRSYFEKFKSKYPTVKHLAKAKEDEVMKMWEGLGYYSRARNLHFTAKFITDELDGVFPTVFESIKKLKGVGDYTASAIASFAYNLPHAVLDGNVFRVFSRFLGIKTAIDSTQGKKEFRKVTGEFLDKKQAGRYNQAIMDFGAMQCVPKNPNCKKCPMNKECAAFKINEVSSFPVKEKKLVKKTRFFNYLVFETTTNSQFTWIQKREGKDIWQNLYQFPLIETKELITDFSKLKKDEKWISFFSKDDFRQITISKTFSQKLTHQNIFGTFWKFELNDETNSFLNHSFVRVKQSERDNFAYPKIISLYLEDKNLTLNLF